MKTRNLQIQGAQKIPSRRNTENYTKLHHNQIEENQ